MIDNLEEIYHNKYKDDLMQLIKTDKTEYKILDDLVNYYFNEIKKSDLKNNDKLNESNNYILYEKINKKNYLLNKYIIKRPSDSNICLKHTLYNIGEYIKTEKYNIETDANNNKYDINFIESIL